MPNSKNRFHILKKTNFQVAGILFLILLAALFGGVLIGAGCALTFLGGGSTGGVDILARLLRPQFPGMPIGKLILAMDIITVSLTGLVFGDVNKALYSAVTLYVCSIALDGVVYGLDYSTVALIISDHHEEIAQAIGLELDRGATFLHAEGSYSHAPKKVVLAAVKKQQLAELKELVVRIDPNAFIILQEAHQVLGDGFSRYSKDSL